jgi:LTXXQ motif family protein
MWKLATSLGAIGLLLCLGAEVGVAQPGRGRPGGGGGVHVGGGGGHFGGGGIAHFGGGGVPHFGGGGVPHFGGGGGRAFVGGGRPAFVGGGGRPSFVVRRAGVPHFAPRVNVGRPGGRTITHFGGRRIGHFAAPHAGRHAGHIGRPSFRAAHVPATAVRHPAATPGRITPLRTHVTAAARAGDPRHFAAHRNFAGNGAFRPFLGGHWRRWHRHHHLGWIGPLFWPYAYGDFFYYALWPDWYWYYDPFWYYGYGDIYEGIFWPYSYDEYVRGPRARARMTALTQSVAQSCADEAAEVTGWPIDQIHDAAQPNAQQNALLDDLGNAIVKASDVIKAHCPTTVSFTPTGRLADMQERLEGMVQAVSIIQPPLAKFYDSLSDEQKARFNDLAVPGAKHTPRGRQTSQNPQAACGENVMAWPNERINRVVRPNDAQRTKLEALQSAAAQAADLIKAACPSELPSTPPGRLEAVGTRLQAMLHAVQTIRPPLEDFYNALSDDQKARFNSMGRQVFAENRK